MSCGGSVWLHFGSIGVVSLCQYFVFFSARSSADQEVFGSWVGTVRVGFGVPLFDHALIHSFISWQRPYYCCFFCDVFLACMQSDRGTEKCCLRVWPATLIDSQVCVEVIFKLYELVYISLTSVSNIWTEASIVIVMFTVLNRIQVLLHRLHRLCYSFGPWTAATLLFTGCLKRQSWGENLQHDENILTFEVPIAQTPPLQPPPPPSFLFCQLPSALCHSTPPRCLSVWWPTSQWVIH